MSIIRVGSRESRLAVVQSEIVIKMIKKSILNMKQSL